MTSKLTREKAQWLHDACEEAADAGIKLTMNPNELLMFTSYALAARDSEPVAWTDEEELRDLRKSGFCEMFSVEPISKDADMYRVIPLYRHAQQPVVPPELTREKYLEFFMRDDWRDDFRTGWEACRAAMLQAGNSPVIPEGYVMVPKEPTKAMILSAMRDNETGEVAEIYDLMLAAAHQPQNAPQNIPEIIPGWIPVSEKLPEEGGRYWCYVEEQTDLGKSHYQWNCSWNGERWWVEGEDGGIVTHWMRLPAAPQEVKGE